jgi:WD40 repeat protein
VTYPPRTGGALAFPGPCVERRYEQPIAFAPDGGTLAIGGAVAVALHDSHSSAQRWSLPTPARATSIAFAPDGSTLAIGLVDGRILLCRVAEGGITRTLVRPERVGGNAAFDQDAARPLAFSPDGLLLAAGYASFAALWKLAADVPPTDVPPTVLRGSASGVVALAFTEDGSGLLVTQRGVPTDLRLPPVYLYRWRLAAWAASNSLPLSTLGAVRLAGQGPTLAAATDGGVAFWALAPAPASRDAPVLLERRNAPVPGPYSGSTSMQWLTFSSRGDFLAGATSDSVYLWDVASATSIGLYLVPRQPINGVALASGGATVAAVFSDGTVYIWQRSA